ncbi:MAG: flavin monoamine oxidase family protein [Bacteroidota bacterium]|jgi:monoamine oxidase
MSSSKTPLLRILRKAFALSQVDKQRESPGLDELIRQSDLVRSEYNRRRFISDVTKAALFGGLATMLPGCTKEELELREEERGFRHTGSQPVIAIIGAGLAGLTCAYQLRKSGINARIYEGANRAGGRVLTRHNYIASGTTTELGGEFIDTGHKTMRGLAAEFGFTLLDTNAPSESGYLNDTFYIDGQHYTDAQVIQAFSPYASIIASDIQSLPTNFSYSNYTASVQQFDSISISQYLDQIGMPPTLFLRKGLEQAYNTEYGREVNDQSAINFLFLFTINPGNSSYSIFGLSDERFKVLGGNQQITDALAASLQGQINLQHKLTRISLNANGQYVIRFQGVPSVVADLCIITIPFTLLRQVNLNDLNLPAWKTNTIQNLGYGTNAKLLLGFNGRKWRDYGHSGGVFTNGSPAQPLEFIQTGWDNTRMQPGTNGGYTVYQGGTQGANLSLAQTQPMLNQLNAMWPGTAGQYNGNSKLVHWPSNPWSLGSYACWRVGQVTTMMGAEGEKVGNLYFAGEHTSLWFQGYMEGAAETGAAVAREIAKSV